MPFSVSEMYHSRKVRYVKDVPGPMGATLEFVGLGTNMNVDDDAAARTAFLSVVPTSFLGMPLDDNDISTLGGLYWRCTAQYRADTAPVFPSVGIVGPPNPVPATPGPTTPLGAGFNFDISGVTEHVTQSKATVHAIKVGGGMAPNNKRAIGITKDGKVQGVDRVSPQFEWSTSVTFVSYTQSYLNSVEALVGTTNNAVFYGWPVSSVLFLGANGQNKEQLRGEVTFKFRVGRNLINFDIFGDGSAILPTKNAWDYVWVSYKDVEDAVRLTQQPDSVYVERIYDPGDFSNLRIGA